jgi:hypothetical protein
MNRFEKVFNEVLAENNASGGESSVFGSNNGQDIGSYGNQFPSQNSNAYAKGDNRKLSPYGPAGAVLGAKVSKKKKKRKSSNVTVKFPIQRRTFSGY